MEINRGLGYLENILPHTHACLLWSIYRVNEKRIFGLQFGSVHSTLSGGGGVAATTHCDRRGCDRYCSHQPKPALSVRSQTRQALVIWYDLVCGVFRLEISKDFAWKFTYSMFFWYLLTLRSFRNTQMYSNINVDRISYYETPLTLFHCSIYIELKLLSFRGKTIVYISQFHKKLHNPFYIYLVCVWKLAHFLCKMAPILWKAEEI